ncbi:translesion DNA synthesis-associated protein ImuA [Pararobbsia silviterrae]|uniref:Translesion DNA synthesis-associated protein ImuA n=1 Tax=Pararobbsia silviterrae TaxID=1792498 RepID=A0A494YC45_9BURK|nr:translesion DNA synthesis-associated protein ImuA [Pararobbsia silviterrae]RKP57534.1 translesion DNA synthesis-associated protein ImuA [Pararobbsia silviterrae]
MAVQIAAVRAGPELPAHLARQVWRGNALGHAARGSVPSGHAPLDAELPDGGWPRAALTELLGVRPGCGEMRLLAPALAGLTAHARSPRHAVLIAPPYTPYAPALAAAGIATDKLVWIDVQGADALWAAEQALRHDGVGAVLLWLPRVQAAALRRLQVLAQDGNAVAFLMRPATAAAQSSPAPLRLRFEPADVRDTALRGLHAVSNRTRLPETDAPVRTAAADGLERAGLRIEIVKRRGPAMAVPLWLRLPVRVAPSVHERFDASDVSGVSEVAEIDHGLDRGQLAAAAARSRTASAA